MTKPSLRVVNQSTWLIFGVPGTEPPGGMGWVKSIMQILTDREIQDDIESFEDRIFRAREKLAELPQGILPYSEHRKRERRRNELQADIKHIESILRYAIEAWEEQKGGKANV